MRCFAYPAHLSSFPLLLGTLLSVTLTTLLGCANSPMVARGRVDKMQQQQVAMQNQNEQLQTRLSALDKDHQETAALLAQERQHNGVLKDDLAEVRETLRAAHVKNASIEAEKENSQKQVQALTASLRRQGGVSITPNNSLLQRLPVINLPGGHVRRDGDVIRVALPEAQLFESGSARLRPGATAAIVTVAGELFALYPDQIVGIEGHTDSDPVSSTQWRNNHELSAARAMAIFDVLSSQTRFQPNQLFTVGHGANHPIISNGSLDGRRHNRRVELVVYPDKKSS